MCVPLHTGGPGLSVVVNAAGITRDKTLLKMSEEAFDEVIKVNLKVHTIHFKLGCVSGNMVGDWQTNSSVWKKDIVSHSLCALFCSFSVLVREHSWCLRLLPDSWWRTK